jgi:hypothetical protein
MAGQYDATATASYWPGEREIFSEEEFEQLPQIKDEYKVTFKGGGYQYPSTYTNPEESGVDNLHVSYDDGLSKTVEELQSTNPEVAEKLKNDFDDWCQEVINGNELEFGEEEDDYEL